MTSLSSHALKDSGSLAQSLRTLSVDSIPVHQAYETSSALKATHFKGRWFWCFRKQNKKPIVTRHDEGKGESDGGSQSSSNNTTLTVVRSGDQPHSTSALQASPASRKASASTRSTFNWTLSDAFRNLFKAFARYAGTSGHHTAEQSFHPAEPAEQCCTNRLYLEVCQPVRPGCSEGIVDAQSPAIVTKKLLPSLDTELSSSAAVCTDPLQAKEQKKEVGVVAEEPASTACCTPISEHNQQTACSSGHSSLNAICSSLFGTTPTKSDARTMQFSSTNMAQLSQSFNLSPVTHSTNSSLPKNSRYVETAAEENPGNSVRPGSRTRKPKGGDEEHGEDKREREKKLRHHSGNQQQHGDAVHIGKKTHTSVEIKRATATQERRLVTKAQVAMAQETSKVCAPIRRATHTLPRNPTNPVKTRYAPVSGRREQSKSPAKSARAYSHTGCRGDTGRVAFQSDRQNHNGDPRANKNRISILRKVKNETPVTSFQELPKRKQNKHHSVECKPLSGGGKANTADKFSSSRPKPSSKPMRGDVEEISATSMGDSSIITSGIMALADTSDLIGETSIQTLDRELNKLCFGKKQYLSKPTRNASVHSGVGDSVSKGATYPPFHFPFFFPNALRRTGVSTSNFPAMHPWPPITYSTPGISSKEFVPLYPSHVPCYPAPYVYASEYPLASMPPEMLYPSTWFPRMGSEPVILLTNQSNFVRRRAHKSTSRSRSLQRTRSRIPRMKAR